MGTNESVRIIRKAIQTLSDKHQEAWNEMKVGKAKFYWESAQTLRRFLDERVNSSKRQGVRQS